VRRLSWIAQYLPYSDLEIPFCSNKWKLSCAIHQSCWEEIFPLSNFNKNILSVQYLCTMFPWNSTDITRIPIHSAASVSWLYSAINDICWKYSWSLYWKLPLFPFTRMSFLFSFVEYIDFYQLSFLLFWVVLQKSSPSVECMTWNLKIFITIFSIGVVGVPIGLLLCV